MMTFIAGVLVGVLVGLLISAVVIGVAVGVRRWWAGEPEHDWD